MMPDKLELDDNILNLLSEIEGPLTVTYQDGEIKILEDL
jgi:hypothetical protein